MIGVIWFVQIVHYPLFERIEANFPAYSAAHQSLTGWVVGPVMLVELLTSALLILYSPLQINRLLLWIGLALVGVLWVSTGVLQVPAHQRLSAGFDPAVHKRLVATNWLRSVIWTLRGALTLEFVWQTMR